MVIQTVKYNHTFCEKQEVNFPCFFIFNFQEIIANIMIVECLIIRAKFLRMILPGYRGHWKNKTGEKLGKRK